MHIGMPKLLDCKPLHQAVSCSCIQSPVGRAWSRCNIVYPQEVKWKYCQAGMFDSNDNVITTEALPRLVDGTEIGYSGKYNCRYEFGPPSQRRAVRLDVLPAFARNAKAVKNVIASATRQFILASWSICSHREISLRIYLIHVASHYPVQTTQQGALKRLAPHSM